MENVTGHSRTKEDGMRHTLLDLLGLNPLSPVIAFGGDDSGGGGSGGGGGSSSSGSSNRSSTGSSGYTSLDAIANEAVKNDPNTNFSYMGKEYDNVFDYHDAIFSDDDNDSAPAPATRSVSVAADEPTYTFEDIDNMITELEEVYDPTKYYNDHEVLEFGTGPGPDPSSSLYASGVDRVYDPYFDDALYEFDTSGEDYTPTSTELANQLTAMGKESVISDPLSVREQQDLAISNILDDYPNDYDEKDAQNEYAVEQQAKNALDKMMDSGSDQSSSSDTYYDMFGNAYDSRFEASEADSIYAQPSYDSAPSSTSVATTNVSSTSTPTTTTSNPYLNAGYDQYQSPPNAAETKLLQDALNNSGIEIDQAMQDRIAATMEQNGATPQQIEDMRKDNPIGTELYGGDGSFGSNVENFVEDSISQLIKSMTYGLLDPKGDAAEKSQEILDAYKDTGKFVYDEDTPGLVVGVEDKSGETVESFGDGYINTETGPEKYTPPVEKQDNNVSFNPCPEGYYLDPETKVCLPIQVEGASSGKPTLKKTFRPISQIDIDKDPSIDPPYFGPYDPGMTIRAPKFAQGGLVTPNIDSFFSSMRK